MKNFNNKIVVVTGAGSGMGRAYALEFAKLGAVLALNDYDQQGLDETVLLLKQEQPRIRVLAQIFDISDEQAVYAFADLVKCELGNAHVIINNAGIGGGGKPVAQLENTDYERVMQINFFGVLYGTRAFLPQLELNREGAIINVSSIFGLVGTPCSSDYCAAKFAVRGFTESLMVELHQSPIAVHLVHPGGIKTNIAKHNENGAEFEEKYLKTDATEIVKYVIKKVKQGEPRIVYGYQARRVWFASLAMPLQQRNAMIYTQMKAALQKFGI